VLSHGPEQRMQHTKQRAIIRTAVLAIAPLAAIGLAAAVASADTFSDIKYTDLVARLGAATPTGLGVGIGQVEANEAGTNYGPDTASAEFAGKTIALLSGAQPAPSGHATEVGRNLFGNTGSIAKGVSSISCWSVNTWVTSGFLNVGSAAAPAFPPAGVRVFNHSWIGSFGSSASDNDGLRRLDFTVSRDNLFVVAGTNNGAGSTGFPLMSYAFNSMSVGLANGNHGNALTPAGIDGPNRRKPDIVAPGAFTSFATPVVGAAGALLFETALRDSSIASNPNAARALTLKTVIMAGTTHRPGWSNGAPTSGAARGITTTPLDPLYGADLLNIDRAHRILTAGETNGSTIVQPAVMAKHQGWDYIQTVASGGAYYWTFRVAQPVDEMSVLASWQRQVATNFTSWNMQDFDLKLSRLVNGVATPISGDAGVGVFESGNCQSSSSIDNAEHLYLRNLAAGDYVLELRRIAGTQSTLPVTVAWYLPNTPVFGDLDGDQLVGAADIAIMLNQWGGPGSGDLNADGIVDAIDIATLLGNWG
jgi:hypothetical protein